MKLLEDCDTIRSVVFGSKRTPSQVADDSLAMYQVSGYRRTMMNNIESIVPSEYQSDPLDVKFEEYVSNVDGESAMGSNSCGGSHCSSGSSN